MGERRWRATESNSSREAAPLADLAASRFLVRFRRRFRRIASPRLR